MHPIEHLRYVARARGADPASLVRETAHALSSMRFDPSGLVVACRRIVERHPDCGPLWWLCARLLTAADPFTAAWEIADEIADDPTATVLARALPDDATVVTIGWPDLAGAALVRRGDINVLAVDSRHEASAFVQRLERHDVACDVVPAEGLAAAVGAADLVVIEALAVSPRRLLGLPGTTAAALLGRHLGVPVWLVVGVGRSLPDEYVVAMAGSATDETWNRDHDVLDVDDHHLGPVSHLVRPDGVTRLNGGAGASTDPVRLEGDCPMAPELLRSSPI